MTSDANTVHHVGRYRLDDHVHYGVREGVGWRRLTAAPWAGGQPLDVLDLHAAVRLLAPVVPGKVVCVGKNYLEHIKEAVTGGDQVPDEPILFLKPPSSVIGPGAAIRRPKRVQRLDPEAELAVVMGQHLSGGEVADAERAIAGVTCLNDVSARDLQRKDGQWTRAKGYDTFCPLGPWIASGLATTSLHVACRVNGETRQQASTSDMIFPVSHLVSFISKIMTLEPGDVIATGTPAGVAPIEPGDVVEVEIEGIGVLRNPVEWAAW